MIGKLNTGGSSLSTTEPLPILSLFSGAGGFDLGFRRAGFKPVLAVDFDPAAVATYRWNQRGTHVAALDIAETNAEEFVDLWIRINGDQAPVGIIGGPPCQAFSVFKCAPEKRRS